MCQDIIYSISFLLYYIMLQKYHKYKSKYLKLKKQLQESGFTTDLENPDQEYEAENNDNDTDILVKSTEPPYPFTVPDSEEADLTDTTVEIKDFPDTVGLTDDDTKTDDLIEELDSDDVPVILSPADNEVRDVGIYGLARGISKETYDVNNKKILTIKTLDNFDNFTQKYGAVKDDNLYIRWDKVQDDYNGVFIDEGLKAERYDDAYFANKYYTSWWRPEFDFKVLIFVKDNFDLIVGKIIKRPFAGTVHNENDFTADDYTDSVNIGNKNKILIINTYDSFDDFTNKFGELVGNTIKIKWDDVRKKFKGFYINKDAEVYPARFATAFLSGKKHLSWWKNSNIKQLVYVFE
jgi:hypothetical protein